MNDPHASASSHEAEDTEGHRVLRAMDDGDDIEDAEGHRNLARNGDGDDTEGHRVLR